MVLVAAHNLDLSLWSTINPTSMPSAFTASPPTYWWGLMIHILMWQLGRWAFPLSATLLATTFGDLDSYVVFWLWGLQPLLESSLAAPPLCFELWDEGAAGCCRRQPRLPVKFWLPVIDTRLVPWYYPGTTHTRAEQNQPLAFTTKIPPSTSLGPTRN